MRKTCTNSRRLTSRTLGAIPVLATLLTCGGSFAMARDLQEVPAVPAGQKRYDNLAPARTAGDLRMTAMIQTDGQVDDEFIVPSLMSETSVSTAAWLNYAGRLDGGLDHRQYSAELFVSNLVNGHRHLEYVSNGDGISFWELNSKPPVLRLVAGGLVNGSNLFV